MPTENTAYAYLDEFDSGLPLELKLRVTPDGGSIIEARLGPLADGKTRLVVEAQTVPAAVWNLSQAVYSERRRRAALTAAKES